MIDILIIILSYFIGSLSSGVIITKYIKKRDIREKDNPGGAGVIRQFGFGTGAIVGLLDILRGSLIAFITIEYSKLDLTFILSYIALVLGNNYPIYFEFRGGQGVGATIGFFLTLFPLELIFSFLVGAFFSLMYHIIKLNRYIKFMGLVPFGTVFGILTIFILIIRKYPFYPFPLLIIVAAFMLSFRGLQVLFYRKKKDL